jgi:hypothetical protein
MASEAHPAGSCDKFSSGEDEGVVCADETGDDLSERPVVRGL